MHRDSPKRRVGWWHRTWQYAVGTLVAIVSFTYLIFLLQPIQAMAHVFVRRWWPAANRRANRWAARSIWGLWVLASERVQRMPFKLYGDLTPPRENAFLIANHQSMADVLTLLSFAWRHGRLGDLKWFVKEVVKYVPGPGWGMVFLDCIFLKRDWAKDRDHIRSLFERFKREQVPIFLVSFLEGTRLTPEKHARAQAFAEAEGLYVPGHTLVPRTKGFTATLFGLRDHLDAIYDITIGYEPVVPSLWNCFTGIHDTSHVHVRRYPVASLPDDDAALADWVRARYVEKDALLAQFAQTRTFPNPRPYVSVRLREWLSDEAHIDGPGTGRETVAQ